jgi:aspartyl-tRNA(Asn)/glutamyl-tRNA(Gln) amidotransferase subunit C
VPQFSRDEVVHLARLSRLDLTEEEIALFGRQLGEILAFARQVEAVDTTGVPEAAGPAAASGDTLRDDTVLPSLDRPAALAGSPQADRAAGLFKVPRVLSE